MHVIDGNEMKQSPTKARPVPPRQVFRKDLTVNLSAIRKRQVVPKITEEFFSRSKPAKSVLVDGRQHGFYNPKLVTPIGRARNSDLQKVLGLQKTLTIDQTHLQEEYSPLKGLNKGGRFLEPISARV